MVGFYCKGTRLSCWQGRAESTEQARLPQQLGLLPACPIFTRGSISGVSRKTSKDGQPASPETGSKHAALHQEAVTPFSVPGLPRSHWQRDAACCILAPGGKWQKGDSCFSGCAPSRDSIILYPQVGVIGAGEGMATSLAGAWGRWVRTIQRRGRTEEEKEEIKQKCPVPITTGLLSTPL